MPRSTNSFGALKSRNKADLVQEVLALQKRVEELENGGGERGGQNDADAEIQRQREILEDLFENVAQGLAAYDKDGRIIAWNRKYQEYLVLRDDQIYPGCPVWDLVMIHAKRGTYDSLELESLEAKVQHRIDQLMSGEIVHFDYVNVHGIEMEAVSAPRPQGGFVVTYADITDRKRIEKALTEAKETADAANKAKSDLVAVVSHEIRTPMNGALGMARLLRETELDENQQECVETIVASGESLLRIVDDLLDISRLEAGGLTLEAVPFIVDDTIQNVIGVMAGRADEAGLRLVHEIDPDIPPVLIGDPHRLSQILLNLVGNAIKFTTKGLVTVRANLEFQNDDTAMVRFAVADTGRGIKAANQKMLFLPFNQGAIEVARKYGGTGLGLTICRRLANLMDSEIVLDSTYGKGSTFHFDVPFEIDRATDAAALRESEAIQAQDRRSAAISLRPLKVLQVEDNATNRDVVHKILSRVGHDVFSVGDGKEALAAIRERNFDIVVMDRHMPRMNGIEATRKIRAMDPPINAIPIVGVTAGAIEAELNACLEAGMDVVLTKPIGAHELRATVARLAAPAERPVLRTDRPVLVVDDIKINLTVARKQLKKLGIPRVLVDSSQRALEMAKSGKYGAVLVDISMPEMDGVEFTKRLREWEQSRGRRTPIVAMTGYGTREDRRQYLDMGFDDFLAKPVVLEALGMTLARWLAIQSETETPDPNAEARNSGGKSDERPPIDLKLLGKILGEDDEGEKLAWVSQFVGLFPPFLETLGVAVTQQDRAAVGDAAHAAKSAASSAAAMPLAEMLERIERNAQTGTWQDIAVAADALKSEFVRVEQFRDGRAGAK